ncbi:hypothetical protein [Nocardia transvalensis]|uniref:hypothetical protein n=1 Tax=Nocardia transvalensis TaxID=37333 RepID=UPI00189537F6|nr:hypothetical protein [Nocardia transvalensis]MBF6329781.1 hypothetical protein [Nocardia transvalensis]
MTVTDEWRRREELSDRALETLHALPHQEWAGVLGRLCWDAPESVINACAQQRESLARTEAERQQKASEARTEQRQRMEEQL